MRRDVLLTNASYAGIATHYIDSSSLPDLEARLAELNFKDHASYEERLSIINDTIEEFTTGIPHDVPMQIAGSIRQAIDYCFQQSFTIKETLEALQEAQDTPNAGEEVRAWATKTKETIEQRSPTSVKVSLRQLRSGGQWNIMDTFRHEYHIASKFMEHPDFVEGVTARLIRKPAEKPNWSPATLDEVTDETVASFFSNAPELELLNMGQGAAYQDYPHAWLGLPREAEVERVVRDGQAKSRDGVIKHLMNLKKGKMGVREKVQEILELL